VPSSEKKAKHALNSYGESLQKNHRNLESDQRGSEHPQTHLLTEGGGGLEAGGIIQASGVPLLADGETMKPSKTCARERSLFPGRGGGKSIKKKKVFPDINRPKKNRTTFERRGTSRKSEAKREKKRGDFFRLLNGKSRIS